MKKILVLSVTILLVIMSPTIVFASRIEESLSPDNIEAIETKYYKTINYGNNKIALVRERIPVTIEITKEEYDSFNQNGIAPQSTTIETNYKKMTTSIEKNGSLYRYKVNLFWKNIPSTRSYDIIGIGFPSSVKTATSAIFSNHYCNTSSKCYTSTGYHYSYNSSNGIGVVFSVPTGNLSSLEQTLYVDMNKNTSSTIIKQYAYGDYAHAVSNISLENAKKFIVNTSGIVHTNNTDQYFDNVSPATATWTGTW